MIHYRHWLALERAQGIGPAAMKEIYDTLQSLNLSIEDIFGCTSSELREEFSFSEQILKGIEEAKLSVEKIEEDYMNLVEAKIKPTLFFEESYPSMLRERLKNTAPAIIYSIGSLSIAKSPCAAILGHSETSEKGEHIAWGAAKELSKHNICVASGLSKGAGVSSHISALSNGGTTLAVIPCGFFTFEMSKKVAPLFDPDRFLIISPFFPTEEYSPFNAMARNRIICALSRAVYIVESTKEGGSFEAAKSASKLGVPLFTTEYAQYPKSAEGNPEIMREFGAKPVRGRREGDSVIPNMDAVIAAIKF